MSPINVIQSNVYDLAERVIDDHWDDLTDGEPDVAKKSHLTMQLAVVIQSSIEDWIDGQKREKPNE